MFDLDLRNSAILNLVTPDIRQISTLVTSFALYGLLSGCSAVDIVNIATIPPPDEGPNSHRTGKNHYEPVILVSNEDTVRIKYLSVGPNAEHEQVMQLISDHCDGSYIETNREELRGYTTVDAECTHSAESLQ